MKIVIDVSAHYDWEPCEAPAFIEQLQDVVQDDGSVEQVPVVIGATLRGETIPLVDIKQNHAGQWLEKVLCEGETHTDISIPESQIEDCMAHYQRLGVNKTRKQVIAWYLGEKVMPHHAHPNHFSNITVEGEPDVEAFLKMFFEVGA